MLPVKTLEQIQETAVAAAAWKPLAVTDPRHAHFADREGNHHTVQIPPPLRDHHPETLDTLAALAVDANDATGDAVLWVSPQAVVLVRDNADRRDVARLALVPSRQAAALGVLDEGEALDQRAFIRLLRLDLAAPADLVARFRKLDWAKCDETRGHLGKDKESLGRNITAQVQGLEDLPETVDLEVPLYDNPDLAHTWLIRLALEVDVLNHTFTLRPLPGALARAVNLALANIAADLKALLGGDLANIPIYRGRP